MNKYIDLLKPPKSIAIADLVRKLDKDGKKIIKLQTGDPCFKTHPIIAEALRDAISKGETNYAASQGLPELRASIAQYHKEVNGVHLDSIEQILITVGAAQAIFLSLVMLLNPQDEVIIFEPYYPQYEYIIKVLGGVARKVPAVFDKYEGKYSINFNVLESFINDKTKAIIINSPNNPSGKIYTKKELDKLADLIALKNKIYLISDEVYSHIVDQDIIHTSLLGYSLISDRVIYINSFSKTYAMTGFRLGYIIADREIIKTILNLSQLNTTCVPAFIQRAGIAALQSEEVRQYTDYMVDKYNEKRKKVYNLLKGHPLFGIYPEGAFYFLLKFPGELSDRIDNLVFDLLNEECVATVPGNGYGDSFKNFIRISFSVDDASVIEGVERIIRFYNQRFS